MTAKSWAAIRSLHHTRQPDALRRRRKSTSPLRTGRNSLEQRSQSRARLGILPGLKPNCRRDLPDSSPGCASRRRGWCGFRWPFSDPRRHFLLFADPGTVDAAARTRFVRAGRAVAADSRWRGCSDGSSANGSSVNERKATRDPTKRKFFNSDFFACAAAHGVTQKPTSRLIQWLPPFWR